jgi:hypothetical protein
MDRDRENREEREAALCLQERQKLGNVERERRCRQADREGTDHGDVMQLKPAQKDGRKQEVAKRTVDLPPVVVEGEHAGERVVGGGRRHGLGRRLRHERRQLPHRPQQEPVRRPAHALRREVRLQTPGPPPKRVSDARRHVQRQPRRRRHAPGQPPAPVHLLSHSILPLECSSSNTERYIEEGGGGGNGGGEFR